MLISAFSKSFISILSILTSTSCFISSCIFLLNSISLSFFICTCPFSKSFSLYFSMIFFRTLSDAMSSSLTALLARCISKDKLIDNSFSDKSDSPNDKSYKSDTFSFIKQSPFLREFYKFPVYPLYYKRSLYLNLSLHYLQMILDRYFRQRNQSFFHHCLYTQIQRFLNY